MTNKSLKLNGIHYGQLTVTNWIQLLALLFMMAVIQNNWAGC